MLPLRCYDLILGEDWLEDHSLIWVDYKTKKMSLTIGGHTIPLQGVVDDTTTCLSISKAKLIGLVKRGVVPHCIQMLVLAIDMGVPFICSVETVEQPKLPNLSVTY